LLEYCAAPVNDGSPVEPTKKKEDSAMSFEQYLAIPTVVDLVSDDKTEAFKELAAAISKALDIRKPKIISDEMLKREEAASTFIGQGLALPQARGPIKNEFAVIVGRSMRGIEYNAARGALAHIIVLLVSREDADNTKQIQLLAEMADFFKSDAVREKLLSHEGVLDIKTIMKGREKRGAGDEKPVTSRAATAIADPCGPPCRCSREIKASAIMVFADAVNENDFLDQISGKARIIVVTSNRTRFDTVHKRKIKGFLQAPSIPASRTDQIKIGILLALSRNLIAREDRIVCISGNPSNGLVRYGGRHQCRTGV
jgi:diadenylate cyclase